MSTVSHVLFAVRFQLSFNPEGYKSIHHCLVTFVNFWSPLEPVTNSVPPLQSKRTAFSNYPDINFNRLLSNNQRRPEAQAEKLKCILAYFRQVRGIYYVLEL